MKTGTEALSARFVGADLPPSLIVPHGDTWTQPRADVIKHPEIIHLGKRRGAEIDRRIGEVVAEARTRNLPKVTILFIAEGVNVVRQSWRIAERLASHADEVEIVLFARGQVSAVPSWIAQRVQSWKETKFASLDFELDTIPAGSSYRYNEIAAAWTGPTHTLTVIPHLESDRKGDALMARFASWAKIPVPDDSGSRVNESLGRDDLVELAEFKRRWAWARVTPVSNAIATVLFNRMRARFRRNPRPRWALTPAQKRAIADSYLESNRDLKKLLGSQARRDDWKAWFTEVEKFASNSR